MTTPDEPRLSRRAPIWRFCILNFAFCIALASCAPKPITLPTDPGTPFPDFATIHSQVASVCSGVRTLTMEIGLSGRAGDQRLRGRVIAGFEQPASMHLEGVAPFGQPVFILAARGGSAVLLLPRDSRIIRKADPAAILEALTGVALAPPDLQAVLTGCVLPAPRATAGRMHGRDWTSIDIESADQRGKVTATLYLRQMGGQWQLRAARRDRWQIEYPAWQGQFPQSVRLASTSPNIRVDIGAALSQIETNRDIDPAAFTVPEPQGVTAMSVDELREAGPLRGQ